MTFLFKIIGFILAVITPFASFIVTDPFVPFDKEIPVAEEKVGEFMKGVCHAEPQYDLLNEANIGWIRDDIPFAFNKDGSPSQRCRRPSTGEPSSDGSMLARSSASLTGEAPSLLEDRPLRPAPAF